MLVSQEAYDEGKSDSSDEEQFLPRPMPLVPPLSFAMVCPGVYRYIETKSYKQKLYTLDLY